MKLSSIVGATLGEQVFRAVVLVLVIVLVYQWAAGSIGWWRADVWKDRAGENKAAAEQAQANAVSANAGAANATETRQKVDVVISTVPAKAEASAQRIEARETPSAADAGPVDPYILRELEDAEAEARAAADRLQRKGTRSGPAGDAPH